MHEIGKSDSGDTAMSLDPKNQQGSRSDESSPTTGAMREPESGFRTLLAATFVVFLGYGTVLPILPLFLGQVLSVVGESDVSLHTGLLTGVYTLALFGFAPLWGSASDRLARILHQCREFSLLNQSTRASCWIARGSVTF